MTKEPYKKELLLVGGGHSHVEVLRRFRMKPSRGARITLISNIVDAPYSGMLPGMVAGHYRADESNIDLFRLAQVSGARFVEDEVIAIDVEQKQVTCRNRGSISYDVLSINIGSVSPLVSGEMPSESLAVKPISEFQNKVENLLQKLIAEKTEKKIGVIGAGAAGAEIILAIQERLRRLGCSNEKPRHSFHLVTSSAEILIEHTRRTKNLCARELETSGIELVTGFEVSRAEGRKLYSKDGTTIEFDIVLWATGARAPKWISTSKLNTTPEGFIRVLPTLESQNSRHVFATGDIAHVHRFPRPKSGVFAVRQGPPLAKNLRRALQNKPLKSFRPQRSALALISLGRKQAIASHPLFTLKGAWIWRYKNFVDKRFIKKYQKLKPMRPQSSKDTELKQEVRCGGCGSKVAPTILKEALASLPTQNSDSVLVGLNGADDAAIVRPAPNKLVVHTIDYFKEFIDDPWILGKIAVNHAINDIFAMGAIPKTALAIVGLPLAHPRIMRNDMIQLMRGSLEGLKENRTTLVGGHTNESHELNIGFSINGEVEENKIIRNRGARAGDSIILTRPLGSGVLLAGAMLGETKGSWITAALREMARSNLLASEILNENKATSMTDITGFGLVGHLSEMLDATPMGAKICLDKLPVYEGAVHLATKGIESTLKPENLLIKHSASPHTKEKPKYSLCFDPQTSGGMLATLEKSKTSHIIQRLRDVGYQEAEIIGEISDNTKDIMIS